MTVPLRDVVDLLHAWYPPATADSWDAVGLVSGDPGQPVDKVLLAVDPAPAVADEAAAWGADLLVVHHPLFLRPVHGVAATTPKGRTLATLTRAGCALLTAHTNADVAAHGVSEALARALGLTDLVPIRPAASAPLDKLVVFVPAERAERVRTAMTDAGAGRLGDYDRCTFTTSGEGRFRPRAGADPAIGRVGSLEVVEEVRIESVVARPHRTRVVRAMLAAHPYEEPAWDLLELADAGLGTTGTGRVGSVTPTTLGAFAEAVAAALPETAAGVRVAGDPERPVARVAVCGGAGDFLLDELADAEVDVYVTSDLRHHPAAEFVERGVPRWSTCRTGRPSGPGCRWWPRGWPRAWGIRWSPASAGSSPTRGAAGSDHPAVRGATTPARQRSSTLKADPFDQLRLLDVQDLDARADRLRHQRATLPELAELADLRRTAAELDHRLVDARTEAADLTAEQDKVDADVDAVRARRERDRDRLDRGLVTNPKDLERLQHELVSLERRINSLEDEELEIMERLEEAQRGVDGLTAELTAARERGAALTESRDRRTTDIDGELDRVATERGPTAQGLPTDLLALYDRLRAAKDGVGAAPLRARACGGCRLTLDPAELAVIKASPSDEVLRCAECQRILVRTPESGL